MRVSITRFQLALPFRVKEIMLSRPDRSPVPVLVWMRRRNMSNRTNWIESISVKYFQFLGSSLPPCGDEHVDSIVVSKILNKAVGNLAFYKHHEEISRINSQNTLLLYVGHELNYYLETDSLKWQIPPEFFMKVIKKRKISSPCLSDL